MSEQKNDYKTQNIRFGIGNKQIIANNTYDNCVVFCVEGKDYKTNKLTEKQIDELFDKGLLKRFCVMQSKTKASHCKIRSIIMQKT